MEVFTFSSTMHSWSKIVSFKVSSFLIKPIRKAPQPAALNQYC